MQIDSIPPAVASPASTTPHKSGTTQTVPDACSSPRIEPTKKPSAHDVYQKIIGTTEPKMPTLTQKRIIRGQNKGKPTGRKDLIKSALCSKKFYGETTCQSSYRVRYNSIYLNFFFGRF